MPEAAGIGRQAIDKVGRMRGSSSLLLGLKNLAIRYYIFQHELFRFGSCNVLCNLTCSWDFRFNAQTRSLSIFPSSTPQPTQPTGHDIVLQTSHGCISGQWRHFVSIHTTVIHREPLIVWSFSTRVAE